MATVVAQASGNFSAGATWVGGVKPQPDDTAQTANYTVTVDENFTGTLNPTGSGHFEITTGGITITGDLVMQSTYTSGGLRCTHATGVVALSGTVTGGSGSSASGAYNASTGTLIVGTATGGSGGNAYGTNNASTGTLTVGTVTGGSGSSAFGAYNASPGTLTVGTVTGGSGSSAFGAYNANAGTMTVGTATGGSGGSAFGAYNGSNGTARIGTAIGNNFGPGGGTNSVPGVYGSGSPGAITTVKHAVHGAYGQAPLAGSVLLLDDAGDNTYTYREVLNGATQVLNHPSLTPDWPAESDVRNGTPYGSGTRTGSAYIPAAASVAYGVPVDATTGTAVLTAAAATAAVWDAARSGHADAGTFGATSEWAGSVDEEAIATAVLDALGSAGNLDSQLSALPAASSDAVWDEALSGHATAGTAGAALSASGAVGDPWEIDLPGSYDPGTAGYIIGRLADIDTTAVTVVVSNDAGALTCYRAATFTATVSGLTISASWTKVYLTVKSDLDAADSASIIQVVETNPGAGTDGLLYLNGAAPSGGITYADAALVVNQAAGTVAITLSDNVAAQLERGYGLHWDLKQIVGGVTSGVLASGTFDVLLTPTRAI